MGPLGRKKIDRGGESRKERGPAGQNIDDDDDDDDGRKYVLPPVTLACMRRGGGTWKELVIDISPPACLSLGKYILLLYSAAVMCCAVLCYAMAGLPCHATRENDRL